MTAYRSALLCAAVGLLCSTALHASPAPRTMASGTYEPIGSELLHKFSVQTGYGPEDSALGNDRKNFHSIIYEPTYLWYSPEKRWSEWTGFLRGNLTYESGQADSGFASDNRDYDAQERPEYFYAELREFYLRRSLLGGDPRFSMTLGRQAYADRYGIFWDDSIESLRLSYDNTFSRGFVAVGQKFWNYNTDVNSLSPREKDTLYVMGEYAWRWHAQQWAGVRTLFEHDHSDENINDPQDFNGWRLGVFFRGDELENAWLTDYHVELAGLDGNISAIDSQSRTSSHHTSGYALIAEAGKRFHDWPWTPRIALRAGITDKPDNENDGFHLNRIQSDRIVNAGSYNTRLVSSFIRINLRNLSYYGASLGFNPTPRSALDFRLTDLKLRSASGDLPVRTNQVERDARRNAIRAGTFDGGRSVGQVLDVTHYWRIFPVAYEGRHINFSTLINAAYFKAGSAVPSGNDYQISVGIVATY